MDLIVDSDVYKNLMTHKVLVLEITKLLIEKVTGTKRREVDQVHPVSPPSSPHQPIL